MKFRVLVLIFNAVIVASFTLIFLMPMMILGWEYASGFWSNNWPFGLAFVAVLLGLNAYFIYNWRVFSLLESESWPELKTYLEEQIYTRGRYGRQRVRILINTYVLGGDSDQIGRLEGFLREKRPRMVPRFALELGIPYLLSQDAPAMERYYGELKDRAGCASPLWVRWNYAFALMLQDRADEARSVLLAVMAEAREPLQQLLSAYLLDAYGGGGDSTSQQVQRVRDGLAAKSSRERLNNYVSRNRDNIQVLMLSRLIDDAVEWTFASGEKP